MEGPCRLPLIKRKQINAAIEIHLFPPMYVNKELLLQDESSEIKLIILLLTKYLNDKYT